MSWHRLAECRGRDIETFFPESVNPRSHKAHVAKRICLRCPVRRECLEEAFHVFRFSRAGAGAVEGDVFVFEVSSRRDGIFGGCLPSEREAVRDDPDRIEKLLRLVELQGARWGLVSKDFTSPIRGMK